MNQNGFAFEYEKPIGGKTPDWLDTSAEIMLESYTYERSGTSSFFDRVRSAIAHKCGKYQDIVHDESLRFAVAVYLDFLTGATLDECDETSEDFRPTFDTHPDLWAVVFFTETRVLNNVQQYRYFCLGAEGSYTMFPKWPFRSKNMR